jgi:general secretion pathway protein F
MAKLSVGQTVELGGQVAELVKAGLPLGPGLRALAEEHAQRRLDRALRAIADRVDRGASLEEAVTAEAARFPKRLRGLLLTGARGGRIAEMLDETIAAQRRRMEVRLHVLLSLAYPSVLLAMMVAIYFLLSVMIVPQMADTFRDFNMALPEMTKFVLWLCSPAVGTVIGVGTLAFFGLVLLLALAGPGTAWGEGLLYAVPVLGRLWKYHALAQCSRLLGLLVELQVPLPEALRLTADALQEHSLREGCRQVAANIEAGAPLAEALAWSPAFPPRLRPLVEWGQRAPALDESFRAAAEMFDGEIVVGRTLLDAIALPVIFVIIAGFVALVVVGLMIPLISLITQLSSIGGMG